MAHFHIKKKKGRPYLYVREIARVEGKPKVISQVYVGSPEKVAALARGEAAGDIKLKVQEFGSLWLAAQIDREVDLAKIVDEVVPGSARETGPSVGEYFLYAVLNRMVDVTSKNRLPDWYRRTAIQQIRPVDTGELNSQRYWEKWERVSEADLEKIAAEFFRRVSQVAAPGADCLLFDTTNYYTFMSSATSSKLSRRGKNKAGRHNLRQVGLALLVERGLRLPLYYRVYPGNLHDSRLFAQVMEEMFGVVTGLGATKERLTVIIDKGMNSEANYAFIDEQMRLHFITTYSTYFAPELAQAPLDRFEPVDTRKNRRLTAAGDPGERLLAWRTRSEFWGRERAVVVTYNPATARKQASALEGKLDEMRAELLAMRARVREGAPHWRDPEKIRERYLAHCQRLHLAADLFDLEFTGGEETLRMSFRADAYALKKKRAAFGKNIILTDNSDWSTAEIVEASLDRWQVEDSFRQSKDDRLVGAQPFRHWTDSKIRCHLFTCVAAMTYLRLMELKLAAAGVRRTAADVMDDMRHLHSVLMLAGAARKPQRRLETPTKTQAEVLKAFGHHVDTGGVLQLMGG
ncbi:MAG: IS1634 family transposase [Thermoleophilia bacterium]